MEVSWKLTIQLYVYKANKMQKKTQLFVILYLFLGNAWLKCIS